MTLKEHRANADRIKQEFLALNAEFEAVCADFRQRLNAKEIELANAAGAFLKSAEEYADSLPEIAPIKPITKTLR